LGSGIIIGEVGAAFAAGVPVGGVRVGFGGILVGPQGPPGAGVAIATTGPPPVGIGSSMSLNNNDLCF